MAPRYGRSARLVFVVILALSAGCAGLLGDTREDEETLTPAPVPTTQPAPAPGVTGYAEIDGAQLVAANDRVLDDTSYRFERTVRVNGSNNSLVIDRARRVRANGTGIERLSVEGTGLLTPRIQNLTLWSEVDVVWRRATLRDGRMTLNRLPTADDGPFTAGQELADAVFATAEFRIVTRSSTETVLESTELFNLSNQFIPNPVTPPRNASARAVITEDGVIRNLTVTYRAIFNRERVHVRISQRVTGLGDTTATRPAWVPANNESVAERPSRVDTSIGEGSTDRKVDGKTVRATI